MTLGEELGVHRRTVYRDIARLREMGIPIHFDFDSRCYTLGGLTSHVGPDGERTELSRRIQETIEGFQEHSAEKVIREVANVISEHTETNRKPPSNLKVSEKVASSTIGVSTEAESQGDVIVGTAADGGSETEAEVGSVGKVGKSVAIATPKDRSAYWYDARQSVQLIVCAIDQKSRLRVRPVHPMKDRGLAEVSICPSRLEVTSDEVIVFFIENTERSIETRLPIKSIWISSNPSSAVPSSNDCKSSSSKE